MTKSNVIELNGRHYDALTGAMLGEAKHREHGTAVAQVAVKQPPRSTGLSMDGFVNHRSGHASHHSVPKKPAHIAAHRPQPTKTLMRQAVKPPTMTPAAKKTHIQAISPLKPELPSKISVKPKLSSAFIDPIRSRRAAIASRSHLVKHFTSPKSHHQAAPAAATQQTLAAPKAVAVPASAPRPLHKLPIHRTAAPQRQFPAYNHNAAYKSPMLNTRKVTQGTVAPLIKPLAATAPVKSSSYEDQDIFEQALAHATSHQERSPKESRMKTAKRSGKKHRRVLGFAAGLAAFVLMCAFVAYQNKANIQLQLASAKAGFSASVPLYKPDGYSLGKLDATAGSVAMAFQNTGSDTTFSVTQKKSNWDSQTLLDNFVVPTNQPYQGYESAGRTIYVYGQGKATWVNGGIWYQIDGANTMTKDQIVKVAASM